jgi:hypothetical protein
MQSVNVPLNQEVTVTILPVDSNGNPALLSSGDVPTWKVDPSSPTGVATVTPASNGLSAVVASVTPGTVQIDVQADSNANNGLQVNASFQVVVPENPATALDFQFSAPVNQ